MGKRPLASKKSLLVLAFAALTLSLTGIAHAGPWGSGGSIGGGYKTVFNDQDLFCDLDDERSTATIDAQFDPLDPSAVFFRFGALAPVQTGVPGSDPSDGAVVCWEFTHNGDPNTDKQTPKGLFTLIQQRMDGGLEASECNKGDRRCADGGAPPTGKIAKRTTWIFQVKQGRRNENLLWQLTPADQATRDAFCKDQNDRPIAAPYCGTNFGLDEHKRATSVGGIPDGGGDGEKANDYPKRDVNGDGRIDLLQGQVFKFTTETPTGGPEEPKDLFWRTCHSGQYTLFTFPGCQFGKGKAAKPTRGKGRIKGRPL